MRASALECDDQSAVPEHRRRSPVGVGGRERESLSPLAAQIEALLARYGIPPHRPPLGAECPDDRCDAAQVQRPAHRLQRQLEGVLREDRGDHSLLRHLTPPARSHTRE